MRILAVLAVIHSVLFGVAGHSQKCPKVTALVLARGGSKSIPLKNLVTINGQSLLGRTLSHLNKSQVFNDIWVSSEDHRILQEGVKYNAKLHHRPKILADDTTTSIDAVQEFLRINIDITRLALIQCTSPFLKIEYIESAIEKFENSDCVFAAVRSHKLRWKLNRSTNQYVALNFDPARRPRRQDWEGELTETGMFYFAKRELLVAGIFQNDRCQIVEVDALDALEIDNASDLTVAKCLKKLR